LAHSSCLGFRAESPVIPHLMRNPESSKAWIPAPRFRGDKFTPAKAGAGMTNQRIGFDWLCFFADCVCRNRHKALLLLFLRQFDLRKIGFVSHNRLIGTKRCSVLAASDFRLFTSALTHLSSAFRPLSSGFFPFYF